MERSTGQNLDQRPFSRASAVAGIALMTGLTAAGAQVAIPLPFTPVPLTLQVLMVVLSGFLLGVRRGASAQLSYLILGAVGAPVFAGFSGGLSHMLGPTGGYLFSYPLAAAVAGLAFPTILARTARWWALAVGITAGLLGLGVIYTLGAGWLALQMQLPAREALGQGVLPFVAVDVAKVTLAAFIATGISSLRDRYF
jgi:biotin transport system substrate-specific component